MMNKRLKIALIGEPNAGKSTLLNHILGEKISIITPKVQTTRTNIKGVVHMNHIEYVFIDTPGIFKPKATLERQIAREAWKGIDEADLVAIMFDARHAKVSDNHKIILNGLEKREKNMVAIINKIDLVEKTSLLKFAQLLNSDMGINEIFMISALKNKGIDDMLKSLAKYAIESEWTFEEGDLTDSSVREISTELTREQIFLRLNKELPYSITVSTDLWKEFDNGDLKIHQTIKVLRPSQKKIVIGDNAQTLKSINQAARKAISKLTGRKVHLFLYVKVSPNWIEERAEI